MSDIYVVLDGDRVVKASTKLQGAELIRADEAKRLTTLTFPHLNVLPSTSERWEKWHYERMRLVHAEWAKVRAEREAAE